MDRTVSPLKSHVEALTPSVTTCRWGLWEGTGLDEVMRVELPQWD